MKTSEALTIPLMGGKPPEREVRKKKGRAGEKDQGKVEKKTKGKMLADIKGRRISH